MALPILNLPSDPRKAPFVWPIGKADGGGLSYVHPYIQNLDRDVKALKRNRFCDPWQMGKEAPMPRGKSWHTKKEYPHLADHGIYLSRHVWLRTLAAAHQKRSEPWLLEKASLWLNGFLEENPFPSPPFPPQPFSFAWPNHSAMDVYFRICNWLDAWATGFFSTGEGAVLWSKILTEMSKYATAFMRLPEPFVRQGNHYLVEHGLAPILLSALLPKHPMAAKLRIKGRDIIRLILRKNFFETGAYAERSLPYSRYVTEHMLIFGECHRANRLKILNPSEEKKIARHAAYFLSLLEPGGAVPPLGDGKIEQTGNLVARAKKIAGAFYQKKEFVHYPDPGVAVLRNRSAHLVFALRGKRLDNYHEHHDVLSFLLTLGGVRLIHDPEGEGYGSDHGVRDLSARRRIRHHYYSTQAHNIPFPEGKNRPTEKEYGPGYYGAGEWRDLGGVRQFWGGRPPASRNFSHKKLGNAQIVSATCRMFPPWRHRRTLTFSDTSVTVLDEVDGAKGDWLMNWKWGVRPVKISRDALFFSFPGWEVDVSWEAAGETRPDAFLKPFLGKKCPWTTQIKLSGTGAKRRSLLKVEWRKVKVSGL